MYKKYLLSLYTLLCNDNKYFFIHGDVFLLYEAMYNDNIYFSYTRSYILSLYKNIYNDNKHFLYMKMYSYYTR